VMTTLDYQTRAERHNRRVAKRFPLFAAAGVLEQVVEPWTAQTVGDLETTYRERTIADRRATYALGALLRRQAAERMTPDELREHDRRFARTYPHKPEYWADFWREILLGKK
jgi:hypothetical protein